MECGPDHVVSRSQHVINKRQKLRKERHVGSRSSIHYRTVLSDLNQNCAGTQADRIWSGEQCCWETALGRGQDPRQRGFGPSWTVPPTHTNTHAQALKKHRCAISLIPRGVILTLVE